MTWSDSNDPPNKDRYDDSHSCKLNECRTAFATLPELTTTNTRLQKQRKHVFSHLHHPLHNIRLHQFYARNMQLTARDNSTIQR